MKKILIAAGILVLILCGCGDKTIEPQRSQEDLAEEAINELNQMIQEEEEAREAEQEAIQNQAEQQNEYIEGIIPAGRYYKNGDTSSTCWTFYTNEDGVSCFMINEKTTVGTYEYDSETGIYYLDFDEEHAYYGGDHLIYEGYFREEDFCFVLTRSEDLTVGSYTTNEEEREFFRIMN